MFFGGRIGFRGHHCFARMRDFWGGFGFHRGHHIGRRAFWGGFGGTMLANMLCGGNIFNGGLQSGLGRIFPGLAGGAFNSGYDLGLYNGIGIGMNQGVGIGYNAGQYNGLIQGLISNPLIGGWLS